MEEMNIKLDLRAKEANIHLSGSQLEGDVRVHASEYLCHLDAIQRTNTKTIGPTRL